MVDCRLLWPDQEKKLTAERKEEILAVEEKGREKLQPSAEPSFARVRVETGSNVSDEKQNDKRPAAEVRIF